MCCVFTKAENLCVCVCVCVQLQYEASNESHGAVEQPKVAARSFLLTIKLKEGRNLVIRDRCGKVCPFQATTSHFCPATRKRSEQTDRFTRWQVKAAVVVSTPLCVPESCM